MAMVNAESIGRTIALLRKRAGWTQRELAGRLGVTDKAVSRWERGLGLPEQSSLARLAKVLGVDIEDILNGELSHTGFGGLGWRGVLALDYAEGLGPETMLAGKRCVYLQVGYFLLAGVREICVLGDGARLEAARMALAWVGELGVELSFGELEGDSGGEPGGRFLHYARCARFGRNDMEESGCGRAGRNDMGGGGSGASGEKSQPATRASAGTMVVGGLDFLYGKDLTRAFRRAMTEAEGPVVIASHDGVATSVGFVPGDAAACDVSRGIGSLTAGTLRLERGIAAFPVDSCEAALDAAGVIGALERRCGERFMDLGEIAGVRGMVR